jgi:hypothetical protein
MGFLKSSFIISFKMEKEKKIRMEEKISFIKHDSSSEIRKIQKYA